MSYSDLGLIPPLDLHIKKLRDSVLAFNNGGNLLECMQHLGLRRGRFAEALGVSEATLSRWLSEDRVPLMVTEICALLIGLESLQEKMADLEEKAGDLKIVAKKDGFIVCRFRPNEDGIEVGRIVAETPDFDSARLVASSERAMKLAMEATPYLDQHAERFEDDQPKYHEEIMSHSEKIEDLNDFVNDLGAWKKRRKPISLDDF